MAFFRLSAARDETHVIRGAGLLLRSPRMEDYEAWARLRDESRSFLTPWEPLWPEDDLTRSSFRRRIRRYDEEIRSDAAYPYLIFGQSDRALLGGITVGQIRRGVSQSGTLGYWMGARHAGRGIMTCAVGLTLAAAFADLRLRRIEAACVPGNTASVRVLERNGFRREGFAREYFCIAGRWEDHLLYAVLRDDPRPVLEDRPFMRK
jgi:ribosomal-protein-alanine N-acetyltransferase